MIHLTTFGASAGVPFCQGARSTLAQRGDTFMHASLARTFIANNRARICPECMAAYDAADRVLPWAQMGMQQILSPHWSGLRWAGREYFSRLFPDPWDLVDILERENVGNYYVNMRYGEVWADDAALLNACRFVAIPADDAGLDLPPDLADWLDG